MNDESALKTIENFFEGKASPTEYEEALDYFATTPATQSRLARLYRDLMQPGGISSETAQELMPVYLDPIARHEMSAKEREQFLLHLTQCPECAEEFLELVNFDKNWDAAVKAPRFKVPKVAQPNPWPERLKVITEKLVDSARQLKLTLRFEPDLTKAAGTIRETKVSYHAGQNRRKLLFSGEAGSNLAVKFSVWAERAEQGSEYCTVYVELQAPNPASTPSEQTVILSYGQQQTKTHTDTHGLALFKDVPVKDLDKIQIQLEVNI